MRGEIELSQLPNPIGRAMYTAVCHSCTAVAQVTPVTAVVLNVQPALAVSVANRGRGSLIQALDFRKVSIKKAEKKVPLGAIK